MNEPTTTLEVRLAQAERDRWLAARLTHLTGTDMAQIVTGDEMKVYLDKHRLMERAAAPEYFYWGNKLQPAILEGYADKMRVAIEHANPYDLVEDPDYPLFSVSLDARWVDLDKRPVDAKNIGVMDTNTWGPDLSSQIPDYYTVQLQMQMAVTGCRWADLAALFGGRRLVVYRVERDQGMIDELRALGTAWWQRHIIDKVQPPITGSETWLKYLATRPQTTQDIVEATQEDMIWVEQLRQARATLKQAEAFEAEARAHLEHSIGEHAGLAGPGFKITFKAPQPSRKTDWQEVSEKLVDALVEHVNEAGASAEEAAAIVSDEYRKIVDACTEVKPASRRFLPSFKEQ